LNSLKDIRNYQSSTFKPLNHGRKLINPQVDTIIKSAIEEINNTNQQAEDPDIASENWNAREKIVFISKMDPIQVYENDTDSETFEKQRLLKQAE
jgi:hypothetical protein